MKAPNVTKENDYEMYFRWWCEELISLGYIEKISREPDTFMVLPGFNHTREKHYKTKENAVQDFTLLKEINYTYDFKITWTDKAKYIFYEVFTAGEPFKFGQPDFIGHWYDDNGTMKVVSMVDVKPHRAAAEYGGNLSTFYTFPFIQKFLMHTYYIYINKVVPIPANKKDGVNTCLFATTFVPNRYLFTDKSNQGRTIHFAKTPAVSYLKTKTSIIENLLAEEIAKSKQAKLL